MVDDRAHEAVEEGEQQGADVRAVHVGVGHEDDLVVAHAVDVEVGLVAGALDAGADGGDHRPHLVVLERLLQIGLLDVEDLASERQDGLEAAVAPLLGRAARRVALDDEELGLVGLFGLAVGQLAGQVVGLERVLPAHQLARLAGRLAGLGRALGLVVDRLGDARVGLEEVHQLLVDHAAHRALGLGVEELALGLTLELRLGDLDRDDREQPLEQVVARGLGLTVLLQPCLLGVLVHGAGVGAAEAREVHPAVAGGDHVGVAEQLGGVALGVDEADVHLHLVHLAAEAAGRRVEQLLALGQGAREAGHPALVVEDLLLVGALVGKLDAQAAGQVADLAHPAAHPAVVELEPLLEDAGVGHEVHPGPGLALGGLSHDLERLLDLAAGELDAVVLAPAPHLDDHPVGERVDHAGAHAVEAARDLVGALFELAAGVQLGVDHLDRGLALAGHHVHGDAAAVVLHAGGAVLVQGDLDGVGVARQGLVDGVVQNFGEELVEAVGAGAGDVHRRALAHALQPLEHLDARGVVVTHFPPLFRATSCLPRSFHYTTRARFRRHEDAVSHAIL